MTTTIFIPPASQTNVDFLVDKLGKDISVLNKQVKALERKICGIETFRDKIRIIDEIKDLRSKLNFYKNYYKEVI